MLIISVKLKVNKNFAWLPCLLLYIEQNVSGTGPVAHVTIGFRPGSNHRKTRIGFFEKFFFAKKR